ncbi:MAG: sigma 54-interacting transcriptional regulator, partial [bacterium]
MHLATENYSVALEYFDKALHKIHATHSNPADLVRIYRKISDCYRKKGLLREAMTFLQSAQSHCDEDDTLGKGSILCRRGIILWDRGEIERALRQACAAYRLLRASDEHREVAHTQLLIANCYLRLGRNEEAEQYYLDALSSYRRIDDSVGVSYVLNNLALLHKNACRWGRAIDFLNKSLEISKDLGLTQHRVRIIQNLGVVHLKRRDFPAAENAFVSARKMARQIGDDFKYTRATLMLGVTETKLMNLAAAEKHLLEARVLAERRNYGREIALSDEFLGDLIAAKGDLAGAMENYAAALSQAKKISPEGDIVAEVLRRITEIQMMLRKSKDALSMGTRALGIAEKCGERHEIGFIKRAIGLAYAQLKDYNKAKEYIDASIITFRDVNNMYEAHRSAFLLCEQSVRQRERRAMVKARKCMSESLFYFERNEEFSDLAQCHFLLARIERELGNRDDCLLHMYEAQRIAEDLRDRNLTRRIRRLRRRIESEVADSLPRVAVPFRIQHGKLQQMRKNPQLRTYLDYILGELMRRLTVGHGFVSIYPTNGNGGEITILAKRGISNETTRQLSEWFLTRGNGDSAKNLFITDTAHDRRSTAIRNLLPESDAPVYFHPLCKGCEPFGLLFFQADGNGGGAPRLGSSLDVVATYAGFIGFLIGGVLDCIKPSRAESKNGGDGFERVLTLNERMLRVLTLAERVAASDSTVLLMGETGTGKGLIAQAIHNLSPRKGKSYIHVNCAALPETILESELFGHVKGAFTGAVVDKKGLLAEADGGTIFLDEIGKTSLPMQGKLLQFLDTKKVRPVGSNEMFEVDVRLIFASKVDLLSLCRDGKMLEDFYYRINDFPITIPPLRERMEDIKLIANHYLRLFCNEMHRKVLAYSDEALSRIVHYEWPGNVREL